MSVAREGGASYSATPGPAPAPLFVSPRLLEGDLPSAPREDLARLVQAELLRLGACEARLDLEMGAALRACRLPIVEEMGFSSLDSYFQEMLGFGRRAASEMITLADRLPKLPLLRELFLAGALPRSRVRIACSVATPESDLRWALACLQHPTRKLQDMATAEKARQSADQGKRPPADSDDDPADHVRVRLAMSADDAACLQFEGVPMLQAVLGVSGPMHVLMEALAADTLSDLGPESQADRAEAIREFIASAGATPGGKDAAHPRGHATEGGACERAHPPRKLGPRQETLAEKKVRLSLHRLRSRLGGVPAVAWPAPGPMSSPAEIHGRLRQLTTWRHGLAWQRGRLLALVHDHGFWRDLHHSSLHEWSDRRLGLGPQECRRLIDLARKSAALPALDSAWREGRVDPGCVALLRQVATPETERDWLDLVAEASGKRVEMEVAAQLALRAELGWSRAFELTGGRPRRDLPMHALRSRWDITVERKLRARRARQAAGNPEPASEPADSPFDLDGTLSDRGACERDLLAGPQLGRKRRTLSFLAPKAVAMLVNEALRQVSRAIGWTLDTGGCLRVMLQRFAETHVAEGLAARGLRAKVLRRDGWRCVMPRCRARKHLDVHHVDFRSRGGSDEMTNLAALCQRCHRLLHDGKLSLTGEAPSGLLVRMGREAPGRIVEWLREGIRLGVAKGTAPWP